MRHKTSALNQQNYHLDRWSEGYFQVKEGKLCVAPMNGDSENILELSSLVESLSSQHKMRLPLLIRFPQILQHRIQQLTEAFSQAITQHQYANKFVPVYPIKVNQQQPVVEAIAQGQKSLNLPLGLEAGSKPELIAVLAQASDHKAVIICNGYKDEHYIRLALLAEKLGHQVYIVVEKMSELPLVLAQAEQLGVQPRLGIRAKLASIGKGNWQNTGGEKSKFGLTSQQILNFVETLKQQDQLDCLQLLHFHLGSQIANIQDITTGLRECTQIYAGLQSLGASISTVDVGGGLGVDYEGTGSRGACSMNYSIEQYADAVVAAWQQVCSQNDLVAPRILTESGRAITAHHAVLISDIIDNEMASEHIEVVDKSLLSSFDQGRNLLTLEERLIQYTAQHHHGIGLIEFYHDVLYWMDDLQTAFSHGSIDLLQRASAENFSKQLLSYIAPRLNAANRSQREVLEAIQEKLADKVFVNFSLFQSLPDIWGIDQIFPILPLTQLDQPIQHRAVLQDITCDSDGRIDQYVDAEGVESSLPLPSIEKGTLLGFFMVGAYQEILGDMHNLFGDTDAVDVTLNGLSWSISNAIQGDAVKDVLDYVNFNTSDIEERLHQQVSHSELSSEEKSLFAQELKDSLSTYTYLSL